MDLSKFFKTALNSNKAINKSVNKKVEKIIGPLGMSSKGKYMDGAVADFADMVGFDNAREASKALGNKAKKEGATVAGDKIRKQKKAIDDGIENMENILGGKENADIYFKGIQGDASDDEVKAMKDLLSKKNKEYYDMANKSPDKVKDNLNRLQGLNELEGKGVGSTIKDSLGSYYGLEDLRGMRDTGEISGKELAGLAATRYGVTAGAIGAPIALGHAIFGDDD